MAAPFPIDPHLTAIAIAYRNASLIADSVLPRVPVGKSEFKWWEYDLADGFTLPNTNVGRTSQPNQVEFNAKEETSSTSDYALDAPVPQSDIDNAPQNYDPLGRATEQVSDLIELDREVRTARVVFSAATYPAGNKEVVAAADRWDEATSKPIKKIVTALDKMIMRPNVAILGRATATALRMNPSIVRAYNGTAGEDGMVPLQFLRDLLELDDILVGSAFVNIARPGQKPQLQRTWANHAAFIYRNKLANTQVGVTFGITAQFGNRISGSIPDKDMGMRGGQRVRVGESVKELIVASDVGYFFQNAVAA
ncbi:phage capsid protein [Pectobacterium carotovorum]|uniref:major capsid protein n=1 Tax=Pectobacterium carotovorum TaxID=554 RepID=UPI000582B7D3|nr:phage capsid protein [Pectobacterium carotovorum]KHS86519.1 phage capsid protein [Pectobacterium carotovorum subsp. carotovorum]